MIADATAEHAARRIDRIGPMDLTILATDRGSVPMNIGAILQFDAQGGPSWATVVELLSARVPTIPRLRQRLRRVPLGCGRPCVGRRPRLPARPAPDPPGMAPTGWRPATPRRRGGFSVPATPPRPTAVVGLLGDRPGRRAHRAGPGTPPRPRRRARRSGHPGRARRPRHPGTEPRLSPTPATAVRDGCGRCPGEDPRRSHAARPTAPQLGRPSRTRAGPHTAPPGREDVTEPSHVESSTAGDRDRTPGRHRRCRSLRRRHRQRRGARRRHRGADRRAPRPWGTPVPAGGVSAGVGTALHDRQPARQQHRGPTDRRPHPRRRPRPTRRDHLPHPGKPSTGTSLLSWPARSGVPSPQPARAVPAVHQPPAARAYASRPTCEVPSHRCRSADTRWPPWSPQP